MYCGHCGAAVEDNDAFCRGCGARFIETPVVATAAASVLGSGFAPPGTALSPPTTDPTMAVPMAVAAPATYAEPGPTQLVPVTTGPPGRGARPFLIGGAFALIVLAGIAAFFVLRGDDSTAQPSPSDPPSPTVDTLAPVETTVPATVATTVPPPVVVTVPASSTTVPPTAPPATPPATGGTVPANTATIPGAPPTSAAPVPAEVPVTTPAATPKPTTAPRPTTTAAPATTASPAPAAGSSAVTGVQASNARAGSVDSCGQPTSYAATNVLDGQLNTAWMTLGDGTGQYLDFTIAPGAQLSQVGLVPGYAKQDPCSGSDRFHDMRRIVEVRWTFDGGASVTQSFDPESETMQTIQLPGPVGASTVRLTILGTTSAGTAGLDYSPISEVMLA